MKEALNLADRIRVLPSYSARQLGGKLRRVDRFDDDNSGIRAILIGDEHRDLIVKALRAYSERGPF